jgi:hypothetical protein
VNQTPNSWFLIASDEGNGDGGKKKSDFSNVIPGRIPSWNDPNNRRASQKGGVTIISTVVRLLIQNPVNASAMTSVATPAFRRQPWKNDHMIFAPCKTNKPQRIAGVVRLRWH